MMSTVRHLVLPAGVLLLVSQALHSQQSDLAFETLPLDQGAATHVSCILQDRIGFIWIAAWSGLYMYDGYSFVSYKHDPDDPSSIADNGLSTLYEDRAGALWIGSWSGIERFDRTSGTFKHFTPNPNVPGSDPSNNVCAICEDTSGALWVGTWDGLYQFDGGTEKFSSMRHDSANAGSIAHNSVQVIYKDREGSLWFGTAAGLDTYDFSTGRFIHCTSVPPESRTLSVRRFAEYSIVSIMEDDAGMIWLGTNKGLVEYNPGERTSSAYPYVSPRVEILEYVRTGINTMCRDPVSASLLVATADGLFTFRKESGTYERKAEAIITSVCVERSGSLLFGTDTGLQKLNMVGQPFRKHPMGDVACGPTLGREGVLWVMGFKKGYHKFDTRAEQFVPFSFGDDVLCFVHLPENGGSMGFFKRDGTFYLRDSLGNRAFTLDRTASIPGLSSKEYTKSLSFGCQTPRGYYIGTHAGGLYLFDPQTNGVSELFNLKQSVCFIHRDKFDDIWVATLGGKLVRYDQSRGTLTEYSPDIGNPSSWNGKPVNWMSEGRRWGLWFGTSFGLLTYDRQKDSFVRYTTKNGLQDNNVRGVAEDDHGSVWVSTTKGISKLDPATGRIKNYDASYGLDPAADVYLGGVVKDANGEMYVGGANGLTGFHPDSIHDNAFIPPIVITSFRKFDEPCPMSEEIHLTYDENFISFEFAALSYVSPERNQHAYMMEGVDRGWVYCGTRRFASYPNLAPGEYVFRVKGSNNEGIWNEAGTSITIVITPPWWQSRWAYGFYLLALVGAAYGGWKIQMRRVRVRHEYEMSRFEARKLQEVDEMKSRFFANISHEFRTPLTLILGPVKQIIERTTEDDMKDDLGVVYRNAKRLLGLVNQLLDLSTLESGSMKLRTIPQNIIPLLKALTVSFTSYAERKRIALNVRTGEDDIRVYIDRDKIEKIVTNILSNALKFTPEGGRIEVNTTRDEHFVNISISDTGIGIPVGQIPKIFDRFYQVDGSHTRAQEGTGIGLSLTKELVELHKGHIEVESEEGKGTTFVIRIPLGKEHLKREEIGEPEKDEAQSAGAGPGSIGPLEIMAGEDKGTRKPDLAPLAETDRPLLLIVEDNADVRDYIHKNVKEEYRILEAIDGEDGWNKSVEHMPDVIVSDVMMPATDGFVLCEKIKKDDRTSHIPVILLTAKASSQDRIEGYGTGADDYIMKPFELEELRARLSNLLEQRKRLHEHFRKHGLFEIDGKKITPVDQKFLQNTLAIITRHLSDTAFGVESLAAEMAVSRSVLLKKTEALVGEPPSELIRRTRLNRAAQLIENKFGNMAEIALEVGFNNPSYFAECFKSQFGCTPSHYHQNLASSR
jgi:signal transduction histidine kinase/ligand-binding sensor domain-containing protein/DNA-binding response OmpR family regulator